MPAQAFPDHDDDPPVIKPGHPMRQRKTRRNPAHPGLRHPDQIPHGNAFSALSLSQPIIPYAINLIGPELMGCEWNEEMKIWRLCV